MCSSLAVSHTTSPTQTGLQGTEQEYILRHPKHTPSICIGARDLVQDQGSIQGVAVALHTHSPAESTPSVCRSELHTHSISATTDGEGGVRAKPLLSPRGAMAPANVTGWV